MAERKPIISFRNFSFQYRAQKRPTLTDIDLEIYPGERVLIAGPSGSGKSTLAGCINGLNPFSNPGACTGTLTVDGVDAPHSSLFELSAKLFSVSASRSQWYLFLYSLLGSFIFSFCVLEVPNNTSR